MPKLLILNNFCHNFYWLLNTFIANKDLLSKSGLEILPPHDSNEKSSAVRFWSVVNDDSIENIKKFLQSGKSTAIFVSGPSSRYCSWLGQALRKHHVADIARICNYSIIGRPALSMADNCCLEKGNIQSVYDSAREILPIINGFRKAFPPEDTYFIGDESTDASADSAMDLAAKLFRIWDIDGSIKKPTLVFKTGLLKSATAIRLFAAASVRDNIWPSLDTDEYIEKLLALDILWQPEPCTPREERIKFANNPAINNYRKIFEEICKLAPGSLNPPDWFETVPGLMADNPLDSARIHNFARSLSETARNVLYTRFTNDHALLNPDQKQFYDILQSMGCESVQKRMEDTDGGSLNPEDGRAASASENMASDLCEIINSHNAAAPDAACGSNVPLKKSFQSIGDVTERPLLTVLTMAHNHEKYIAECMDSVLAQKTDFPVHHVVLDHFSTDGTREIISQYAAKYPSIKPVLPAYGSQYWSNVRELFIRCKSKYAALCDGDDYFIDDGKLQMQVDFLEQNPACSMVFHPVILTFEDGQKPLVFPGLPDLPRGLRKSYYLSDIVKNNFIRTNTVVYRWRFRDGLPDWFNCSVCPGDWYWHLLHAEVGKIGFITRLMSVYRRHATAMYVHSFQNSVYHRKQHGLRELAAYDVYNRHFNGRFFQDFAKLAKGVLIDFLILADETDDNTLLMEACEKFPDFYAYFREELKNVGNIRKSPASTDMEQ